MALCLILALDCSAGGSAPLDPVKVFASCRAGFRISVVGGWLLTEPSLGGTVFPSRTSGPVSSRDITRMIRIYFPRTFEGLADYDFILLASVDMVFFTNKQAIWMYRAIDEAGLGGLNTRSVQSMSSAWAGPWVSSPLSGVFPNDAEAVVNSGDYQTERFADGPIIVNDEPGTPPILTPFKGAIENRIFVHGVVTEPRPGSTVYSWVRSGLMQRGDRPGYIAHLFSWEYRNATTFTAMDMVCEEFWRGGDNPYSLDIASNLIWYSTGRDLPEDALMVHALRDLFREFQFRKSTLISMFDFAENFGANTGSIYSDLEVVVQAKSRADQDYLRGDFERSYGEMKDILEGIERLEVEAVELKNSALAWVFLIEWLSVSAALLVSGLTIWQLMIRRTIYREISITRLSEVKG